MSKHIKLEDAINDLDVLWDHDTVDGICSSAVLKQVKTDLQNLPTIEIVRCKNCKHWGGVVFGNKCTMLSGLDYVLATKENDFCSYGERMESDEE